MEAFAASARFARYIFRRTCIFLSVMHKLTLFLLWSFKNLIDPFIMFLGFGLLAVFTKELFECGINVECVVCSFVIAQGLFSCNFFWMTIFNILRNPFGAIWLFQTYCLVGLVWRNIASWNGNRSLNRDARIRIGSSLGNLHAWCIVCLNKSQSSFIPWFVRVIIIVISRTGRIRRWLHVLHRVFVNFHEVTVTNDNVSLIRLSLLNSFFEVFSLRETQKCN